MTSTQTRGITFDVYEEVVLDQFILAYENIEKFTTVETCECIWTNGRCKDDFWITIYKVLTFRGRSSVCKHVWRRYHLFERRGKWTPQDYQQLVELCFNNKG